MRGVGLFEFGGPGVLKVFDRPEGDAGSREVRIRFACGDWREGLAGYPARTIR